MPRELLRVVGGTGLRGGRFSAQRGRDFRLWAARWPAATISCMDASNVVETTAIESAAVLAAVADPVRWRLVALLADGRTRCVCDLSPIAAVAQNLLSYHLKVLREAGLVTAARRGRWVDYTIAPDALPRLRAALPEALDAPTAGLPVAVTAGGRDLALDLAGGSR